MAMEINIKRLDDDSVEVNCSGECIGYGDIVMLVMSALEGATVKLLLECDENEKSKLYDTLDSVFGNFLEKVFPDIDPEEFTLIDAAIVKAQDEIINDAYDRGITLEEALQEYHDKAVEYIKQRRLS